MWKTFDFHLTRGRALGHHMSIDQKVIFPVHLVQCKSVYTQPFLLRTLKSAKPPQQQQQGEFSALFILLIRSGVSVVVSGAPQNFGTMRPVSQNLGVSDTVQIQINDIRHLTIRHSNRIHHHSMQLDLSTNHNLRHNSTP